MDLPELAHSTYLGDSVYAGRDNAGRLWIYIDNGGGPASAICLETDALSALLDFSRRP